MGAGAGEELVLIRKGMAQLGGAAMPWDNRDTYSMTFCRLTLPAVATNMRPPTPLRLRRHGVKRCQLHTRTQRKIDLNLNEFERFAIVYIYHVHPLISIQR